MLIISELRGPPFIVFDPSQLIQAINDVILARWWPNALDHKLVWNVFVEWMDPLSSLFVHSGHTWKCNSILASILKDAIIEAVVFDWISKFVLPFSILTCKT